MNPEYKKFDVIKENNRAIIDFILSAEKKVELYKLPERSPEEQKECFLAFCYLVELYVVFDDFIKEMTSEKGEQKMRKIEQEIRDSFEHFEKFLKNSKNH